MAEDAEKKRRGRVGGELWPQVLDSELSGQLTHLGQFPFLILGDLAVFASEVTAPQTQSASTGM